MSTPSGSSASSPPSGAAARRRAASDPDDGESEAARLSAPPTAVRAVLAALVLGALLNGPGLVSAATRLELGPTRTVAMAVAVRIEALGGVFGLDRPRNWLADVRNGELDTGPGSVLAAWSPAADPGPDIGADTAVSSEMGGYTAPPAPGPARAATEMAGTPPSDEVSTGARGSGDTDTGARSADQRPATADDPLQVLLIGDSLIGNIADGFGRVNGDRDTVRWDKDVRISTGLARPDVLDWHDHLDAQIATHEPDMVVLMLGGNDDQSLVGSADGVIHYGQDGWEEEYQGRAAELLDIAGRSERLVVWLELPAMRPQKLEEARVRMNGAVRSAAEATDAILIDTAELVAPAGYSARLDGVQVRMDDGVHLTHEGGDRVAAVIDRVLREHFELPEM